MQTAPSRLDPITLSISEACKVSGISRSELYRRLASGQVCAVKSGRTTLILMESLRAHLARLPAATFRRKAAA